MRFTGTLTVWNDARGFGFIAPTQGGQDVFVHIKAFPAGTGRPAVGLVLSFELTTGADGRKQARAVQFATQARGVRARQVDAPAVWTLPRRLAVPAFAVLYGVVAWRWGSSWLVLLAYLGFSVVAMLVYAVDKSAAESRGWRVSESTLHLLGLAGGWPGALLAQQALRHKTRKPGFVRVFWLTVLTNAALLLAWHAGWLPLARPGPVLA